MLDVQAYKWITKGDACFHPTNRATVHGRPNPYKYWRTAGVAFTHPLGCTLGNCKKRKVKNYFVAGRNGQRKTYPVVLMNR